MTMKMFLTQKELESALEDVIDELEGKQNDIVDAVYIPPEDVDSITDEEDLEGDLTVLENRQEPQDIAGTFELYVPQDSQQNDELWDSSDEESLATKKMRLGTSISKKSPMAKWVDGHIRYTHSAISQESVDKERIINELGDKSPLEIFQLFIDNEVLDMLLNFSIKYAQDNNRHDFSLSKSELLNFIGILLLSGYHKLPQIPLYWSSQEDKGIPLIKACMSRNRFQTIKQNLHLSDNNNLNKNDKFAKVRPFLDILNKKNLQWGVFSFNLCIDEQMVPYFGRHSCKMFIKGKPVRFGFKLWCLCSADGYLFYNIPYAGASEKKTSELGLGGSVVMDLLSVVDKPSCHQVFFDNFFTSFQLIAHLKNKGFFATGTIRENRTGKCPLEVKTKFSKRERGALESKYDANSNVSVVRWNDNANVTVCSNTFGVLPINKVKRYNRKEKKDISVDQPYAISQYNKFMGGVDLHDNGIANYRCSVMGKKWWWPLFANSLDSTVVNAWKLYNIVNEKNMSRLEFKSYLALRLIKSREAPAVRNVLPTPNEIRYDGIDHTISSHETKSRRRCRMCHNHTIHVCTRCQVHLHVSCFAQYHQK